MSTTRCTWLAHTELTFGNQADVVAEETELRRDEIADGKVSLRLPRDK
jgi:hypothetical protein